MMTSTTSSRVTPTASAPSMCAANCGLGRTERGERGDGRQLAVPQRQPGPPIDVPEPELDDVAREVRRDVREGRDEFGAAAGVDLVE